MRHRKQFNIFMLAISAVIGAAAWILCAAVYGVLSDTLLDPVLIGLIFGLLTVAVTYGVFLVSTISDTFEKNIITGGSSGSVLGFLALATVLLMVLAGVFQWIYSLRFRSEPLEPTSYIFLIDNSGSMSDNDPRQLRYSAIEQVLEDRDSEFPYMIYGFAEDVTLLREMQPASVQTGEPKIAASGGTGIKNALQQVMTDYQNGLWDGGATPKVVLLSDGLPTDFQSFSAIRSTLQDYAKNSISISTVGLGNADVALMEKIADHTGGVFVDIQDASMLADAMTSAARHYSAGDLVTTRYDNGRMGPLFGFLRVLFLTVLGVGIGTAVTAAYGQMDSFQLILLTSMIKAFVGALLLELSTSLLDLPDQVFWFILWVLIAATFCTRTPAPVHPGASRSRERRRPVRRGGRSNRNIGTF